MRYIVVGTGAIGGTVGGWLTRTGHDVVVVARGEHGRIILQSGLDLAGPDDRFVVHPEVVASVDEWVPRPGDVLMLAVKSQDAGTVLPVLAAKPLGSTTVGLGVPVFCLQNGISNEREALRYFAHVHGVSVTLPATYLEPGRIDAHGSPHAGILELGRYPGGHDDIDEQVAADLEKGGFLAVARDDVMAWKSAKLLQNLNNALEALCTRASLEAEADEVGAINAAARHEALACFEAEGITVIDDEARDERLAGRMTALPVRGVARKGGSTWQSIARGLPSVETDHLNGEIALLGRLHGIPTPVNEYLQTRTARLTAGGTPESTTPREIRAALSI